MDVDILPLEHEIYEKKPVYLYLFSTDLHMGNSAWSANADKQALDRKCRAMPSSLSCASNRTQTSQFGAYQLAPLDLLDPRPTLWLQKKKKLWLLQPLNWAPDPYTTSAGWYSAASTTLRPPTSLKHPASACHYLTCSWDSWAFRTRRELRHYLVHSLLPDNLGYRSGP